MNPQIAARLVTAMGTWRRYDAARQGLMRRPSWSASSPAKALSHNTYEMASKVPRMMEQH